MVRGVYWNIKFVSQPWWCIFSRCLTHVLGRVGPPIMFSSWVWVEPRSARRRKPETSIPVHWSTQKQTKCEKPSFQTLLSLSSTSANITNIASNTVQKCSRGNSNPWAVVRYGQRPVQWAGASLCPLQGSEKEKKKAPSWLPMFLS